MVSPAAAQLAEDFGITSTVMVAMTISIFVLAYGAFRLFPFFTSYFAFGTRGRGDALWRCADEGGGQDVNSNADAVLFCLI